MKRYIVFMLAFVMAFLPAAPAQAKTNITTVTGITIDVSPNSNYAPGEVIAGIEPRYSSSNCTLTSWSTDGSTYHVGQAYYYTFVVETKENVQFGDMNITVIGASNISVTSLSKHRASFKAKVYPFCRLENPTGFDGDCGDISWKKVNHANKYVVYAYYEKDDDSGTRYSSRFIATDREFSLSDHVSDFDEDSVVLSVKAINDSEDKGKYISGSYAVFAESEDIDTNVDTTRKSAPSASISKKQGTAGSTGHGASNIGQHANQAAMSGTHASTGPVSGWIGGNDAWYYLEKNKVAVGWRLLNGKWYYLNPNGIQEEYGKMVTGWQYIDGYWYCFAPDGAMYSNCITPDGYPVNESGRWIH